MIKMFQKFGTQLFTLTFFVFLFTSFLSHSSWSIPQNLPKIPRYRTQGNIYNQHSSQRHHQAIPPFQHQEKEDNIQCLYVTQHKLHTVSTANTANKHSLHAEDDFHSDYWGEHFSPKSTICLKASQSLVHNLSTWGWHFYPLIQKASTTQLSENQCGKKPYSLKWCPVCTGNTFQWYSTTYMLSQELSTCLHV